MPTEAFWPLARVWYEGRFDMDYQPRSREDAQRLLDEHGLRGPFWDLSSDPGGAERGAELS